MGQHYNTTSNMTGKDRDDLIAMAAEHEDADESADEESNSITEGNNVETTSPADITGAEYELDPDKRKEARKMRRVMANRRSARESRERRKKLLTDLQDSVKTLTDENVTLTKE